MYEVRVLDAAARELERLEVPVARRIVSRIHWFVANLDQVKPESLTGGLAGFYRLRVGDYRVVYEILHSDLVVVIHLIGHRRDIYRRP